MSTKHTPGPWKYSRTSGRVAGDSNGTSSVIVCEVPVLKAPGVMKPAYGSHATYDRGEDNARLIAAAPDMLNALRFMLTAFNAPEIDPLVAMVSVEKARAAVNKATGQD